MPPLDSHASGLLDGALEVINGLYIIFVCSEVLLNYSKHCPRSQHQHQHILVSTMRTHLLQNNLIKHYILPWAVLNLLLWKFRLISWLTTSAVSYWVLQWVSPLWGAIEVLGTSVLIWLLLMIVAVALRVLLVLKKGKEKNKTAEQQPITHLLLLTWRQDLYYVTGVSMLCVTVKELGFDDYVQHTELIKVSVLLMLFCGLLFVDSNRYTNNISLTDYCVAISQALMYAVFALPVAAILISCFFLLLTSALQKLGADPEHSLLVNKGIYYGVLYGPLYVVYWHAKKTLIAKPYLPW